MHTAVFRRYLQPSRTLRWHPWAPLVAAGILVAFVFAFGASWGFAVAKRMSNEEWITAYPWTFTRAQIEAMRPARTALDAARAFDAAVIAGARKARDEKALLYRWRVVVEHQIFDQAWLDRRRNPNRNVDLHAMFGDNARRAAEYRLDNLAGNAPYWKRTANLCEEMNARYDMSDELSRAAAAYTAVLGRTVTAEQLAPLSGAKC